MPIQRQLWLDWPLFADPVSNPLVYTSGPVVLAVPMAAGYLSTTAPKAGLMVHAFLATAVVIVDTTKVDTVTAGADSAEVANTAGVVGTSAIVATSYSQLLSAPSHHR